MIEALRYLQEAQEYLSQIQECDTDSESMLLLEEVQDTKVAQTEQKNSELKQKATGSISKAISAVIESLGSLITSIINKIKTIFTGKDNVTVTLKAQYSALVNLIPQDTNSYRVQVKNYGKFYKEIQRLLTEIERARKSGNKEQVKTLRQKLTNYFGTEVPTEEIPLSQVISMVESANGTSDGEVKRLERLRADLQKTMNNLKNDDAGGNAEDAAELQWESQQASKSISGWFKGIGETAASFGRATKDLIAIAKSKGKDVGSILALCNEAGNNKALRTLVTGVTGAGAAIMDRGATEDEKTIIGSATRVVDSDGKVNKGAAMRLANTAMKNNAVTSTIGAVGAIGSQFIKPTETPKQRRIGRAARNTANDLLR